MRKYRILALLFLCLLAENALAQQSLSNLEKYWNYRQRLNEEFLVVGPGQGMSIPADHRSTLIGQIKWSDATVDQGWYLGTLATEHYLLSNPDLYPGYAAGAHDLADNTGELYYALKAMQRLDLNAETAFILCPGLPNANGFFIRDDVPLNFHLNFPGMSSTFSDFVALDIYDKEMSQDQMYHVLMGCSLVKGFVGPNTEYNGENLVDLAQLIATKIVGHVGGYSNWLIKNPVCNKPVDRGPDAWSLSFGTNEMIKWITDGAVDRGSDIEVILNEPVWPAIGQAVNPIHINSDNTHMIMTIGAVGRVWQSNTLTRLMNLATLQDFYLYPMLHAALYGTSTVSGWQEFSGELQARSAAMQDEAPDDGPASPQPLPGTHGWATANRFIRDKDDQVNGGGGSAGRIYHGLDYMLLYNLHQILFGCQVPEFEIPAEERTFCTYKKDVSLAGYGSPEGGVFSGPGVLAGQFFNPSVSGPGEHVLYYTLSDSSGCSRSDSVTVTVDLCTGIDNQLTNTELAIFPNPSPGRMFLRFRTEASGTLYTRIMDPTGRLVSATPMIRLDAGEHLLDVDLEYLSAGAYLIQITWMDRNIGTLPFVLLK